MMGGKSRFNLSLKLLRPDMHEILYNSVSFDFADSSVWLNARKAVYWLSL